MTSVSIISLLSLDYSKFSQQFEVDDYIRRLRDMVTQLKIKNDFLLEKKTYLPMVIKKDSDMVNFTRSVIESCSQVEQVAYIAVTITYDPRFFPQLIITPLWEQENYIKRVLAHQINNNRITSIYGCFELQKNGRIHFHGIIPVYGSEKIAKLEDELSAYFTSGTHQKAIKIKPVDNIQKWLDYINKKEEYKTYLEYNMKVNNSLHEFQELNKNESPLYWRNDYRKTPLVEERKCSDSTI